jgi:peptide/nickel transport system substrate-binding protein
VNNDDDYSRRAFLGLVLGITATAVIPGAAATAQTVTTRKKATAKTTRTTIKKTTTTKAATTKATTPSTATPTTAVSSGGSAAQGTLKFGAGWPFTTWDPHDGLRSGTAPIVYWRPVFDTLFTRDANFDIKPGLVTKWDFTEKGLTMTLREGVKFSDGSPFNADVVVANIRHMLADPRAGGIKAKVIDFKADGPDTVRINTSGPIPDLVRQLASQRGMIVQPSQFEGNKPIEPIGTGPYLFDAKASTPGQKLVYVLNPNYWNKSAQVAEKIEMTVLADPGARVNALLTGQVDVTYFDNALANQAIKAGIKSATTLGSQYSVLVFDRAGSLVPALANRDVRLALGWAIDRSAFANATLPGIGSPALQSFRKGDKGYDPELDRILGFDREFARQLMAKAGYANGFTLEMPSTLPFQQPIEILAAQWREIGVNVKLVPLDISQYGGRGTSGAFPLLFVPVMGATPYDVCNPLVDPRGGLNPFRITDSAVLQPFEQLERAFDDEKDRYLGIKAMKAAIENGLLIPLANADKHAFYRNGATGVVWNVDEPGVNPVGIRPGK